MSDPTAHLQLTDVIMAQLRADPPLTDGPIARGRALLLGKQFDSAIGVRLARAGGNRIDTDGATSWQTAIVVECCMRAVDGDDAHAAVDPLLQSVYQRICAGPLPVAAAGWSGDPELAWDTDPDDPTVGLASLILRINHITGPMTLASAS